MTAANSKINQGTILRCSLFALMLSSTFLLSGCAFLRKKEPQIEREIMRKNVIVKLENKGRKEGEPEIIYPLIDIPNEPEVQKYVDYYTGKGRKYIERGLKRRAPYIHEIEVIFRQHGLPLGLANIAFVESCYENDNKNPAGPEGIWQFCKETGLAYGLEINGHKDERLNIILSTQAAARHLRDLYEEYGDWLLAVAAYNCGSGCIARARRNTDWGFFELARTGKLPPVTVEYVPKFLAITKMMRSPKEYGFKIDQRK